MPAATAPTAVAAVAAVAAFGAVLGSSFESSFAALQLDLGFAAAVIAATLGSSTGLASILVSSFSASQVELELASSLVSSRAASQVSESNFGPSQYCRLAGLRRLCCQSCSQLWIQPSCSLTGRAPLCKTSGSLQPAAPRPMFCGPGQSWMVARPRAKRSQTQHRS